LLPARIEVLWRRERAGLVECTAAERLRSCSRRCPSLAVARHSSSPGSSSAAPTSAIEVCRSALASHTVISGTWSTVGGVRSWIRGGVQDQKNRYPLADAFPGAAAKESAAWCWTRDQPQTDAAWAVRSDAPPVHAITLTCQGCQGGRPIPSGAPLPVP
jgi:hypothetical protein